MAQYDDIFESNDSVSRRRFLELMAASAALSSGIGCRKPEVAALPYTKAPERLLPGVPEHYATSLECGGRAIGVIATCHEGRPIKLEGNPDHPASLGASDPIAQALILELYDPDRSQKVLKDQGASSLESFTAFAKEHFDALKGRGGEGLYFLGQRSSSPSLRAQRQAMLKAFPKAKWHFWEALNDDNARAGQAMVYGGSPVGVHYDLAKADVIVSLDCDFLGTGARRVADTQAFAARRRPDGGAPMNRLYAIEPGYSLTGAAADHRVALPASRIPALALALAAQVGKLVPPAEVSGLDPHWLAELVAELKGHAPRALVLAGPGQPPRVHAAECVINSIVGRECVWGVAETEPEGGSCVQSITELAAAMRAGKVATLVVLGDNPVYDAPADLELEKLLRQVKTTIHLGLYANETAQACGWHVPAAHALESWGDTRTSDGTVALAQPMIAPLYGGLAETEFLALLASLPQRRAYDILRAQMQAARPAGFFEAGWRKALRDGVLERGGAPGALPSVAIPADLVDAKPEQQVAAGIDGAAFELVFLPHPYLYDGRYANNAWLQETPEPITKLSWDNAALMSPGAAKRLGVMNEDAVKIEANGRAAELPVWIVPGMDDGTVAVHLGFGRRAAGRVGNGVGVDVYPLRTTAALDCVPGVKVTPTGRRMALSTMQLFSEQGGRPLVREASLAEFKKHPAFAREEAAGEEAKAGESALWRAPLDPKSDPQWAMAIDLTACVGCHACVLACQAENNIPVVGKEQIAKGRIMQWLRIDRYHVSAGRKTRLVFQPLPCQQCETAPCEQVCPVAATTHSPDGLNEMTYNRCVGTRYCSNNCPFKVRRFNFFNYREGMTPVEKLAMNPDVTVRMRGVMEKCTYCVQRIVRARVAAKAEGRGVRDGEMQTACQQACPARAIVFGNQADPASKIAKIKENPRNYVLLGEVNLRPRTSYLAKVGNPNPNLEEMPEKRIDKA